MKKYITWVIALIVVIGAVVYFANKNSSEYADMDMTPSPAPIVSSDQQKELDAGASAHAPTTVSFTVNGGNFYFTPSTIKVKKGDTVKLTLKNDGGFHDLVVAGYNAATKRLTAAGAEETISFVADKTGSFEYYCSVGDHKQKGMKGTLIVE